MFLMCAALLIAAAARGSSALPEKTTLRSAPRLRTIAEQQRLLGGHLLRRLGFGPSRRELSAIRRIGLPAYWTGQSGQLVYYPPTVFSFYRPGQKGALVHAAFVAARDAATDMIAAGYVDSYFDASWDAAGMIRRQRLAYRPARAIDLLARDLLAAPLSAELRAVLLDNVGPEVTEEKLRGLAWLLLCSPDYQLN